MLNRQSILDAQDLITRDVEVQEWGGVARVRMLRASERDRITALLSDNSAESLSKFRAALVVSTLIGEDGERVFADDEDAIVMAKSAAAVDRIFAAAADLNRMGGTAVEDVGKNSEAAPSGDSSSASPSSSDAPSGNSASA